MLYNVQEFFSLTHKGIRNKVGDMFGNSPYALDEFFKFCNSKKAA